LAIAQDNSKPQLSLNPVLGTTFPDFELLRISSPKKSESNKNKLLSTASWVRINKKRLEYFPAFFLNL
jgi:hypothetical protein